MAPRRPAVIKVDYKKLSAIDVICPICRSILIKPVTLPCSHGFCAVCFEAATQNASSSCPECKVRVSSWLRSATKSKTLINEALWKAIQENFPSQVKKKIEEFQENHQLQLNSGPKTFLLGKFKLDTLKRSRVKDLPVDTKSNVLVTQIERYNYMIKEVTPKNQNQLMITKKSERCGMAAYKNFATKEYTCRVLCQNVLLSDKKEDVSSEYITLLKRKNRKLYKITGSEGGSSRCNSIELECLYFKPIDHRHNPPSKSLAPIKVPCKKPNTPANFRIIPPGGQNKILINSFESAFARLFSSEHIESKNTLCDIPARPTVKRKLEKNEGEAMKKLKNYQCKGSDLHNSKRKTKLNGRSRTFDDSYSARDVSINASEDYLHHEASVKILNDEVTRKLSQEQEDFELAKKLQQTFDQSSKYSTRSSVLKAFTFEPEKLK